MHLLAGGDGGAEDFEQRGAEIERLIVEELGFADALVDGVFGAEELEEGDGLGADAGVVERSEAFEGAGDGLDLAVDELGGGVLELIDFAQQTAGGLGDAGDFAHGLGHGAGEFKLTVDDASSALRAAAWRRCGRWRSAG